MGKQRKQKCKHCQQLFHPNPRNAKKQKYCSQPECRKASKAASQQKWLGKPENQDYFRGPDNVQRVQEWRRRNPGYWQKQRKPQVPLQDHLNEETTDKQEVTGQLVDAALQDLLSAQDVVFIGLLAQLSGSALQDDIVMTGRHLQLLGQDILNQPQPAGCKGGTYDIRQTAHPSTHDPPDS